MIFGILRRISRFVFFCAGPSLAYFARISLPSNSVFPADVWYLFFSTVSRSFTHFRLLARRISQVISLLLLPFLPGSFSYSVSLGFLSCPVFFRSFRCPYSLSRLPQPLCRSSLSSPKTAYNAVMAAVFHGLRFLWFQISHFFARRGNVSSHLFRLAFSFPSPTAVLL